MLLHWKKCPQEFTQKMPKKIHPSRKICVDKKWPRKLSSENVHENSPSCNKGSLPRYFLNDLSFNLYNHELMFRQIRSKTRFSNWVDLKKDWVALKKFSILLLPCRAIGSVSQGSHFFYYEKLKWKKISIWKCEFFLICDVETFCHLDRANSIETNLRTCNLRTFQFISYKFPCLEPAVAICLLG